MKDSSNLLRRAGLTCLGLGAVATTLAFTFTLNKGNGTPQNPGTGLPIKWPAKPIPIRIMLGDTTTLFDRSNFNTSARAAALAWNAVIGSAQLQTTFATGTASQQSGNKPPLPPVNELAFAATIFGKDFGENVLAVTTGYSQGNERTEADIIFKTASFTWDSYRGARPSSLPSGTVDLQRVAIHELGHLLGLDHPDEADPNQFVTAIMNSWISSVDALTSDDIEGVQSLYGPPGVPANDAFAYATTMTLVSSSTTLKGVNTNATKESGELSHAFNSGPDPKPNPGGRSVWWHWTAPSAGSVTLDTRGSYYDTILGVYTGSTLSGLTKIASNDDTKIPTTSDPTHIQASTVTFDATSGTVYRIAVDGFNNNDGNGADSGGITLNLSYTSSGGTLPVITQQPASVTVLTGGRAVFSVLATSATPVSYQWLFNSTAINGATGTSYEIGSASSIQAGTYSVVVTNTAGAVTSEGATLTVNTVAPPPSPPPSTGRGGGGGGAPSLWFCAVLAALGAARLLRRNGIRNFLD